MKGALRLSLISAEVQLHFGTTFLNIIKMVLSTVRRSIGINLHTYMLVTAVCKQEKMHKNHARMQTECSYAKKIYNIEYNPKSIRLKIIC